MAPPELARDAPVVNVVHPLEVSLLVHLRREADVFLPDSFLGLVGQRLNLHKPLRGKARLDDRLAAVAVAHAVGVVLDFAQEALLFEIGDDLLARHIAVEAGIRAAVGIDVARIVHDVDRGQMMALADGEVVGVVRGSNFYRAGAEVAADPLVENNGNFAADERQAEFLAVQVQIALVFRMNGNRRIAQQCFRPRGCNR
jgi:hypothetical protein